MDTSDILKSFFNPFAEMPEDGLEEVDGRLQDLKSRRQNVDIRLQNVKSYLQNVRSMPKGSSRYLKLYLYMLRSTTCQIQSSTCRMLTLSLEKGPCARFCRITFWGDKEERLRELEEGLSRLEEDLSMLEKEMSLEFREESQPLIIQAMSIFGVSLGSDSMEGPKWKKGPIERASERASDVETLPWMLDETTDYNEKLSSSSMSGLWSPTPNLRRPDIDSSMLENKTRLEESQLFVHRAMSIFGETLESGSMEWPKLLLNKGPTKPGDPASDVQTLPMTPEEIRDHNEKLLSRLAPVFTENLKSALRPVLGPVVAALEEERKHQDTLLKLEEKLALKRRGVGRPQRRRRASSARRLRPRTRQLRPRLSFPWKR